MEAPAELVSGEGCSLLCIRLAQKLLRFLSLL